MAYLVFRDEWLLRVFSKPLHDGVHSDLGKMASGSVVGSWRRSAVAETGDLGEHRVQRLVCNFCFFRSLCAIRLGQLFSVSYHAVPVFLWVPVCVPYL